MLLDALLALAGDAGEPAPPLYEPAPCRYVFRLTKTGEPEGDPARPEDHDTAGGEGQEHGEIRLLPSIERGGLALKPWLMSDYPEWTFGSASGGEARAARRSDAYSDLLERCLLETGDPAVEAVRTFLGSEGGAAAAASGLDPAGRVGFRVDGEIVTDRPAVQRFWWSVNAPGGEAMECIGCGLMRPAMQSLKTMVKGVRGTNPGGGALVSANRDVIESWGLRRSTIAPLCAECGEAAMRALNGLLRRGGDSVRIGGLTFAAWTPAGPSAWLRAPDKPSLGDEEDDDGDSMKPRPRPASTQQILAQFQPSVRTAPGAGAERLFAVALKGERGRVAVRDWIETTAADAIGRAADWFEWQKIAGARGEPPWQAKAAPPIGIAGLVLAAATDTGSLPAASRSLMRSFLTGEPLPLSLLARAVGRVRALRAVHRNHAALIKAVLRSQHGMRGQEDDLVTLNPASASPAYHCGRLLAVLERLQERAIATEGRKLNRTVIDKHMAQAMALPASVFPRLILDAERYCSKLRRSDRPADRGAGVAIRKEIEELTETIGSAFPRALPIGEQGQFVLGCYHQRAASRAAAARSRAGGGGGGEESDDSTGEETDI